jgi:hypothetical protein
LVLNGAGVRTRFLFKVYVSALFLAQKKHGDQCDACRHWQQACRLHLLRGVTADTLISYPNGSQGQSHDQATGET